MQKLAFSEGNYCRFLESHSSSLGGSPFKPDMAPKADTRDAFLFRVRARVRFLIHDSGTLRAASSAESINSGGHSSQFGTSIGHRLLMP